MSYSNTRYIQISTFGCKMGQHPPKTNIQIILRTKAMGPFTGIVRRQYSTSAQH